MCGSARKEHGVNHLIAPEHGIALLDLCLVPDLQQLLPPKSALGLGKMAGRLKPQWYTTLIPHSLTCCACFCASGQSRAVPNAL